MTEEESDLDKVSQLLLMSAVTITAKLKPNLNEQDLATSVVNTMLTLVAFNITRLIQNHADPKAREVFRKMLDNTLDLLNHEKQVH